VLVSTAAGVPGDAARHLLSALWERNLPLLRARMNVLDRAAHGALHETLTPAACAEAADTAHKLAGSLGMFGYPRGTEIAREIEQLFAACDPMDPVLLRQLVTALQETLPL
jgi:HPt (histidine-containing phosphotransfer) domain-containing protein